MTEQPVLNDDDHASLVRFAADLLYPPHDPRAVEWPDPVTLGLIRSHLRGLADDLEHR